MSRSRKKPPADLDDTALLEFAFKDVRPLAGRAIGKKPALTPPAKPAAKRPAKRPAPPPPKSPAKPSLPELAPGAVVGIDRRTAQRLKRGKLEVDARLDLHGHTQEAAHVALSRFLAESQATGRRCVLVITGKGARRGDGEREAGVLRAQVPHWLNQPPNRARVLSFATARPADGGEGALYVLLKKARP